MGRITLLGMKIDDAWIGWVLYAVTLGVVSLALIAIRFLVVQ